MKDALGHGSDAHSSGVQQVGTPQEVIAMQNRAAIADRIARQAADPQAGRWGASNTVLPSGHTLYTSVAPKQGNSRGARRGGHDAFTYNIKAPGEQYSKRIAVSKIADHWAKGHTG